MNKWCVQVLPGILVGTLSGRASGGESVQPHTTGPAPGVPRASGGESGEPWYAAVRRLCSPRKRG